MEAAKGMLCRLFWQRLLSYSQLHLMEYSIYHPPTPLHLCVSSKHPLLQFLFKWGIKIFFYFYLTLLQLLPHRFHCVRGCLDWTQDCCKVCISSQTLFSFLLKVGFFPFFKNFYLTLLQLLPHRFHCVRRCWGWTHVCCKVCISSQALFRFLLADK